MKTFYNTIETKYNQCPSECTICAEACSKVSPDGCSLIEPIHLPGWNFHGVMTCNQCGEPRCAEACPTGAITKSEETGVVAINQDKCMGCGLCDLNCPYGGIHYAAQIKKSFNCDLCGGEPKCVEACPENVLTYFKSRELLDYVQGEDLMTPGTPLCAGCPMETTLRLAMKIFGRDTFLFGCAGCAGSLICSSGLQSTMKNPTTLTLMTNVPSVMTGVKRYYKTRGEDVRCVCFVGDGATVDVGFQPLSGAAERNENLIYICYDNEAYMNTGIQRSGSTPLHGWTFTTPSDGENKGKAMEAKYMPLIMLEHNISYIATATIGYPEDLAKKLKKAMAVKDGLSYLHLLTPCPTGWRHPPENSIEVCRAAVDTNYWPLWEAEHGKVKITKKIETPAPMENYTKLQKRFAHFDKALLTAFKDAVYKRYQRIVHLSQLEG